MSRRLPLLVAFVLVSGVWSGALPAVSAADGVVARGEHYALHFAGTQAEADEALRVLEAAYEGFKAYFGAAPVQKPGERLVVRFLADRAGFDAAIRADGTTPPKGAGGYYGPGSRTAYLFRQPTLYFTRVLLIHEAAHQFHFLARTRNRDPGTGWYTEGVAEFLSWHMWDGATLRLGVRPAVSLKDYAKAALQELRGSGFDLGAVIEGRVAPTRAMAWALYRWLAVGRSGKPQKGFKRFAERMDRGAKAGPTFRKGFGRPERVTAKLRRMLEADPQPFEQVFNQWEPRAPGRLRGTAQVVSLCRARGEPTRFSAVLEVPPSGSWQGGLLLSFVSKDDYTVLLLAPSGTALVNRRQAGRWKRLARIVGASPTPGAGVSLAATRTPAGVEVTLDGRRLGPFALPAGAFGLALDHCTLVWRDIQAN